MLLVAMTIIIGSMVLAEDLQCAQCVNGNFVSSFAFQQLQNGILEGKSSVLKKVLK